MTLISDLRIAILVEDGVSQRDLSETRAALEKAGVKNDILSSRPGEVKSWESNDWGIRVKVDKSLPDADPASYDGLIIPDGPLHTDQLRGNTEVLAFVRQLFSAGKLIAAIGNGAQVLLNAEILKDLRVTSSFSIKTDLALTGALWSDEEVSFDNGVITCQGGANLEEFNNTLLDTLRKGIRQRSETII